MADVLVEESSLSGIADAIRGKTGETSTYKPREMAEAISKITGGGKTKFGMSIDNVIGDVNADGALSAPEPADVVLEGVKKVSRYDLHEFFWARSLLMPDLVSVEGNGFYTAITYSPNLESVSFPSLETVSGAYAFYQAFYCCSNLSSVSFPKLKRATGSYVFRSVFYGTKLTKLEFPSLEVIDCDTTSTSSGAQFGGVTPSGRTTVVSFPKLKEIYANGSSSGYGPFYSSWGATRFDLPALTTIGTHYTGSGAVSDVAIKNMFCGCSNLKEIHFGSANQAAVEAMPGYDTLWGLGAGKATVYFDL